MIPRRTVLGAMALPLMAAWAPALLRRGSAAPAPLSEADLKDIATTSGTPEEIAHNEDFWRPIQQAFTIDRSCINLNNGGVSPAPMIVQEAAKRHLDRANTMAPPVALWREQEPRRETVRERLALEWGVSPEELALTRNSSESLQICQFGLPLKSGDEVLTTTLDYPRMLTTFNQRERREGIVHKQFSIPIPCEDPEKLVRLYAENITPRTRMILMSHIINITGQIMPVAEVVAMARTRNGGIPVIVDGAHALAHFDFEIPDLDCDYYGVSLHKWLFAPHGTGLLYVRRDRIQDLWPMMASPESLDDDIRKFEEIGTHPMAATLAIAEALTFHQAIGGPRKEARLRSLRDTWATQLLAVDPARVKLHTSFKPAFSCGIATVQVEGLDSVELADWLWAKRRILVTAIKHDEFSGIRVTPSLYTTQEELSRFVDAVAWAIKNDIPET